MGNVNITNVNQFFGLVDKCEGRVELVTKNGDQVDLKATLSQYFSMVKYFAEGSLSDVEIITHNDSDAEKLHGYTSNN